MVKSYHIQCPKCNNKNSFQRYGKDKFGNQKYRCKECSHQFAPDTPKQQRSSKYHRFPKCGKAMFMHHDYQHYSNFRCCDKLCNHSLFVPKSNTIAPPSMYNLFGKHNFKRMCFPIYIILSALSMFYLGKNSFRNIALILKLTMNIKVSHTTISNWCTQFAPLFQNISLQLIPMLDFNSDEWHMDETVVKIKGVKHYLWLVVDSETHFVLGFHLSSYRDSPQAFALMNAVKNLGKSNAVVSGCYGTYKVPVKSVLQTKHIRVQSFLDDVTNNLIECFNKQFKAWYKTKQGFSSFRSANNLISTFIFFFNFIRPHSALSGLTPAECAGLNLSPKLKHELLLVS